MNNNMYLHFTTVQIPMFIHRRSKKQKKAIACNVSVINWLTWWMTLHWSHGMIHSLRY